MWLDRVGKEYGDRLEVNWKNFQLEQVNSKEAPEWKVWEKLSETEARSLMAAKAGEAARRQGKEAFHRFHLAMLKARHGGKERAPLNEEEPITEAAREAGLDIDRFTEDMKDPSLLEIIARDHEEAVDKHGAFGTPTFVFENGQTAYLKTFIPPEDKSVSTFEHFMGLMADNTYIGELKRPQPPWPKGAVS